MDKNSVKFWNKVLNEIKIIAGNAIFGSFFSRVKLSDYKNNILTIECPDEFILKNIEKKYKNFVEKAVKKAGGKKVKIKFVIKKPSQDEVLETGMPTGPLFNNQKDPGQVLKEKILNAGLSPKFTFDNFIMGQSNQLAYAIATAIAERPGEVYNPVFFYSGVGLGKTHLLQAVGNKILETKPGTKVIYTTGESFTNELVDAIQSGKGRGRYASNNFRNKFRKADVFLIDDVQFIAGKEATQEEFFHTFNALHMAQKQIVITSDRPPKDFTNIEERITSRFNSGIIADIQAPDIEMRMAILRTKRDIDQDPIPNNVINLIAEYVTNNIRELEGAYLRVLTYSKATGETLTPEVAAQVMGKTVTEKAGRPINMNQVLNAVCTYFSIKGGEVKGKRRTKDIVIPRQVAMYLIKELTDTPYITIGDFLGGRDHSTIMHGVDKIEKEKAESIKLRQDLENVKQIIYMD